jgi:hypothetical protein
MKNFNSALSAWEDSKLNAYLKSIDDEDQLEADIQRVVYDHDDVLLEAIRAADSNTTIKKAVEMHYERILKYYDSEI